MADENNAMDLYFIQDPDVVFPDDDNTRGYNRDLIKYYKTSIPIRNIHEFIARVSAEVAARRKLIKKLVIGSHGNGLVSDTGTRFGHFYIGETNLTEDDKRIELLKYIAPLLVKDADVYIVACKTGLATPLLQKVSKALGGVRVHGYTDYITTTNYLVFVTLDDGTDDEGAEVVCLPGHCFNKQLLPRVQLM